MKKFRCTKARSYNTVSPLGHRYVFSLLRDTEAVYGGEFYQEDEDWMSLLTTKQGGNILTWTNPPEAVKEVQAKEVNPMHFTVSDIVHGFVPIEQGDVSVRKTESQIQAEVNLSRLECGEDVYGSLVGEEESSEDIEPPNEDDSDEETLPVEVESEPKPESESVVYDEATTELLNTFAKHGADYARLKQMYKVAALQALCETAKLDTEGTKRVLLERLYSYYSQVE